MNGVVNRLRSRPATEPFIPTHAYAHDDVLDVLKGAGCRDIQVVFERADDLDYAMLFVRKPAPGTDVARHAAEPIPRPADRSAAQSASAVASDAEIDAFNRAADAYYATLANWDHHLAKPFSQIAETPAILANLTVMLQSLELSAGLRVLDFGGGTGWLSRHLTQLGCRVVLLDVSPTALAIAREHYARHPVIGDRPAQEFLLFDGRRIDLPDASVDRILCFDPFHHAANPEAMIREVGRILAPAPRRIRGARAAPLGVGALVLRVEHLRRRRTRRRRPCDLARRAGGGVLGPAHVRVSRAGVSGLACGVRSS